MFSDRNESASPSSQRAALGVRLLIVAGTVAVVLAGLGLMARWILDARDSARFQVLRGRYAQIGLALHNYHDVVGRFPPGGTFAADGTAHHSWTTMIRPYLDASPFYNAVDFDQPWNSAAANPHARFDFARYDSNRELFLADWANTFHNPQIDATHDGRGFPVAHLAGSDRIFFRNSRVSFSDLKSGAASVMLAGECFGEFPPVGWPGNWRDIAMGLRARPDGFGAPNRRTTLLLMADGSSRPFSDPTDPVVLESLADRISSVPGDPRRALPPRSE